MKINWKRPSGLPLETNDRPGTIEYLESLGYKQIKEIEEVKAITPLKLNKKKGK